MAFRVVLASAAEKAVARLPKQVRLRITDRLIILGENPRPPGSRKLSGEDAFRIRVGSYRIIYEI